MQMLKIVFPGLMVAGAVGSLVVNVGEGGALPGLLAVDRCRSALHGVADEEYIKMENNYNYFQNSDCVHFPCHPEADSENFSCLFCYCPCYLFDDCPGDPDFSIGIKDCSKCDYPHKAENYYNIVDYLMKKTAERKRGM